MPNLTPSEINTDDPYILVVGNGRLARHLTFYFTALCIRIKNWNRKEHSILELQTLFQNCDKCLLLIKDDAIENFSKENHFLINPKKTFHCSGALNIEGLNCIHPLMTFANELYYPLETYKKIPFALFKPEEKLKDLFPQLDNPHFYVPQDQKLLYHALCVMSGNFVQILWSHVLQQWKDGLKIPPSYLEPYIQMVTQNFWSHAASDNPISVLTGPLPRHDFGTINKHLRVLQNNPETKALADMYYSFLKIYFNSDE